MRKIALSAALTAVAILPAYALQAPDTLVMTGPSFQQVPVGQLYITIGGTQQTLTAALNASGGGCSTNCTFAGVTTLGTGANPIQVSAQTISVSGAGNSTLQFTSAGTAGFNFNTGNGTDFQVSDPGVTVANTIKITGGGTGNGATILATGDTNAQLNLKAGAGGTGGFVQSYVPIQSNGYASYAINNVMVSGQGIGPGSASSPAFWQIGNYSGVNDTGAGTVNNVTVNDAVDAHSGNTAFPAWVVTDNLMTGYDGGRGMAYFTVKKTAAAATTGANYGYDNLNVYSQWAHGDGGTNGNWLGTYTGFNPDITCHQGDYVVSCIGMESDVRLFAGTNAQVKVNMLLLNAANDANHGSVVDTAIDIASSPAVVPGTGGNLNGIMFGGPNVEWPLDPTVTTTSIITATPNNQHNLSGSVAKYYAGYGVDFAPVNFMQYAWRSTGFWVDNVGNQSIGPGKVSYTTAGLSLTSAGVTETSAVIVAGGTNYVVGDQLMDPNYGLWTVATLTGSAVATVTALRPGFAATCPASPTATTGGGGMGATLNITCTASGAISLGGTGQNVKVGTGSALATTATTGFLQLPTVAGTPTGTVGTAGAAAVVIDTTNKKICYSTGGTWECSAAFTP